MLFNSLWPMFILMIVFALVVGLGPEAMSTGQFMAFNLALAQSMAAVMGICQGVLPLLHGLEQYDRFRPILKVRPENVGIPSEPFALGGSIRLAGVSFRYEPEAPLTLDAVDLQVRPGEFVAIVGASGSGKSGTLAPGSCSASRPRPTGLLPTMVATCKRSTLRNFGVSLGLSSRTRNFVLVTFSRTSSGTRLSSRAMMPGKPHALPV